MNSTANLEDGLRERHKAERRRRILDSARELLRENPAAKLSTERIAERAEVSPATVYNLIGPRNKVWQALATSLMEDLERRLDAGDVGDPVERARQVVRSTVKLFVEDPAVSQRMLREWEESALVLDRGPLTHLCEALESAQREGILHHSMKVEALAAVVGSACVGAMHQWVAGMLDDDRFEARALLALDVTLAAGAAE